MGHYVQDNPLFSLDDGDDEKQPVTKGSLRNFYGSSYAPDAQQRQLHQTHTLQNELWKENRKITRVGPAIFVVCGLTSLVMMAVTVIFFLGPNSDLHEFGVEFLGQIDGGWPRAWEFALWGPFAAGAIMLMFSCIGFCALNAEFQDTSILDQDGQDQKLVVSDGSSSSSLLGTEKGRSNVFKVAAVGASITVLLTLIFGGLFLALLFSLDEVANLNQDSDEVDSENIRQRLLDYQVALFNGCCAEQGWSLQGEVQHCEASQDCTIPPEYEPYKDKLCTCYSDKKAYDTDLKHVKESNMCEILSGAEIQLTDADKIPGTSIQVSLLVQDIHVPFPVVGDNTKYGCGLGFAKGFQWMLFKWLSNTSQPLAITVLATGTIQGLLLLLLFFQRCTEAEERYFEEVVMNRMKDEISAAQSNNVYTPRTQRRLRRMMNIPSPMISLGGKQQKKRDISVSGNGNELGGFKDPLELIA